MESNYRKFFMKSHDFYLKVLENEQPGQYGHDFKMFVQKRD